MQPHIRILAPAFSPPIAHIGKISNRVSPPESRAETT